MKCPSCGAQASGKFCSSCGKPLLTEECLACGAFTPPGSRFCTSCGQAMSGTGAADAARREPKSPPGSNAVWWGNGVLLVLAILAVGFPVLSRSAPGPGPDSGVGAPGTGGPEMGGGLADLTSMPLEEQALVLFNRVMISNSAGNVTDVAFFLPKALAIHEQLSPTDQDGLYHHALLLMVAEEPQGALDKALKGLEDVPDYLLLLAVAGEASAILGDSAAAREFYAHFLEVYDAEMELMRFGYDHHKPILPVYRDEAIGFLRGG